MPNDKSTIFIYYDGKIIEGKISNEIINDELLETINNMMKPLDSLERFSLHESITETIKIDRSNY